MAKKRKQKKVKLDEGTLINISILVVVIAGVFSGSVEGTDEHPWDMDYPYVWVVLGFSIASLFILYRMLREEDTSKIPVTLWSFIPLLCGLVALGMEIFYVIGG